MSHEPIPILLNPVAGRGRAARYADSIVQILESHGIQSTLMLSTAVGDLERLASEQAAAGAGRLIVAGGDGSVHEVVNGILKVAGKAALGLIPIGTGNDFAKATDTPLDWKIAASRLAERLRDGVPPRTADAGRINGRFSRMASALDSTPRSTGLPGNTTGRLATSSTCSPCSRDCGMA